MSLKLKASPSGCEEASTASVGFYVPCNAPAVFMVGWEGRKEGPYRMCESCAWHNTHNRGARVLGPFPAVEVKE